MSPTEINVTIARELRTHLVEHLTSAPLSGGAPAYRLIDKNGKKGDFWSGGSSTDLEFEFPARYIEDLNAMAEAEKALTDDEYYRYEDHMWDIIVDDGKWVAMDGITFPYHNRMSSATALQRAKAFLRVKNLWKEDPTP